MSAKTSTNATSPKGGTCATKTSCCAWKFAAALLLLRLCLGFHFFSEGTKKLSYDKVQEEWELDFSAEGFFRGATGPFASLFKSQLPGVYDWQKLLAVPTQALPLSQDEVYKRQDWQSDYAARRKAATKDKKPLPFEFPEYAPYKAWGENIVAGLSGKLKAFTDLSGIDDEQDAQAATLFLARQQQLADMLSDESQSIEDYQHDLWRLQNMEATPGSSGVPFLKKRLTDKQSEAKGLGAKLVSAVRRLETDFNNDLRGVLTAEQRAKSSLVNKVEKSITSPKARRLKWLNLGVTSLIIGVGVCLLLGLFTRLAAIGGILFLLSVMVTQLPWVAGAKSMLFFYQLVECAALLALAASSPWRLPGIDYLLRRVWNKCCSSKK